MRVGLFLKRSIDLLGAIAGLLLFAVPMLLIFILTRLFIGSPALFRQIRPGQGGKPFTIYKFRTLTDKKDEHGSLLPDDARLTPFGCFLRSTSLDELPEFINILKGEMSLVGPRPLLMEYLKHYTPEQARRHEFKPGITGWAQVNGRNALSWEEKFRMDVWYVENWSLWLDIKIVLITFLKLLRREGINAAGHVTAPRFTGLIHR